MGRTHWVLQHHADSHDHANGRSPDSGAEACKIHTPKHQDDPVSGLNHTAIPKRFCFAEQPHPLPIYFVAVHPLIFHQLLLSRSVHLSRKLLSMLSTGMLLSSCPTHHQHPLGVLSAFSMVTLPNDQIVVHKDYSQTEPHGKDTLERRKESIRLDRPPSAAYFTKAGPFTLRGMTRHVPEKPACATTAPALPLPLNGSHSSAHTPCCPVRLSASLASWGPPLASGARWAAAALASGRGEAQPGAEGRLLEAVGAQQVLLARYVGGGGPWVAVALNHAHFADAAADALNGRARPLPVPHLRHVPLRLGLEVLHALPRKARSLRTHKVNVLSICMSFIVLFVSSAV